jgi:hypothetical protein
VWASKRKKPPENCLILNENCILFDGCEKSEDFWERNREDLLDILRNKHGVNVYANGAGRASGRGSGKSEAKSWKEHEKARKKKLRKMREEASRRHMKELVSDTYSTNASMIVDPDLVPGHSGGFAASHNARPSHGGVSTNGVRSTSSTHGSESLSSFYSDLSPYVFSIFSNEQREFDVLCPSKEEKTRWVTALKSVLLELESRMCVLRNVNEQPLPTGITAAAAAAGSAPNRAPTTIEEERFTGVHTTQSPV